jgi:hypothetical protein
MVVTSLMILAPGPLQASKAVKKHWQPTHLASKIGELTAPIATVVSYGALVPYIVLASLLLKPYIPIDSCSYCPRCDILRLVVSSNLQLTARLATSLEIVSTI